MQDLMDLVEKIKLDFINDLQDLINARDEKIKQVLSGHDQKKIEEIIKTTKI